MNKRIAVSQLNINLPAVFKVIVIFCFLAMCIGVLIPFIVTEELLRIGAFLAVFALLLQVTNKQEVTSLWNIVCVVSLITIIRVLSLAITSKLTWSGRTFDVNSEQLVTKALVIITLSLLAGKLGYKFGQLVTRKKVGCAIFNLELQRSIYVKLAFLLIPIGLMARFWIIGQKIGGISGLFLLMRSQNYELSLSTPGMGYMVLLAHLATASVLLLFFLSRTARSWWMSFIVMVTVLPSYILTGRRTEVFPLILGAIFSYHYKVKRIKFKYWLLFFVVVYIFMNSVLIGRLYFSGKYPDEFLTSFWEYFTVDLKFGVGNSIDGFLISIANHSSFGEVNKWSYAPWYSFIWYLIPRALFPEKPYYTPIGRIIRQTYFDPMIGLDFKSDSGVAPTVFTTLYLNAGYIGIILGMFVLGICLGFLDKYLLCRETFDGWLFHLIVWMLVFILFRTGDLTASVTQLISMFGGLIFVIIFFGFLGQMMRFNR